MLKQIGNWQNNVDTVPHLEILSRAHFLYDKNHPNERVRMASIDYLLAKYASVVALHLSLLVRRPSL